MALITPQAPHGLRNAKLVSTFEAPVLVTRLDASWTGTFTPRTQTWADYWQPVHWLGNQKVDRALSQLGAAWQRYIASKFDVSFAQDYCFRYFSLLATMLTDRDKFSAAPLSQRALQAVLGFESFTINGGVLGGGGGDAAGTTTLRNPCYLLAMLRSPETPDETRFHPLLLAGNSGADGVFHHYRRYRLSGDVPVSLLVYPSVDPRRRPRSFRAIANLAGHLGFPGDPFADARGKRLWEHALLPIMQNLHTRSPRPGPIELVDIGAGSGALTATLAQELLAWSRAIARNSRLRLWLIDIATPASTSIFRTPPLGPFVEKLVTVSMDYRDWLASPRRMPAASGARVAIASKIFDVSSRFVIRRVPWDSLSSVFPDELLIQERYMPERCLAPGGGGPDALGMSSLRLRVPEGHAFPLPSLSQFFDGLRLVSQLDGDEIAEKDGLHLPTRSLDPQSLVAADGVSVLDRLLQQCDYLIVEDADLRPEDLIDHLAAFSLSGITAQDMTRAMDLKANYAYVLWPKDRGSPHLQGERIW